MGMYIHKVLGYGLNDMLVEDDKIIDPRINPSGYLMVDCEEQDERWDFKRYMRFLRQKNKTDESVFRDVEWAITQLKADKKKTAFYNYLKYDEEFGLPNVFCMIPPNQPSWCRVDDAIDYYLETMQHESSGPRVELLPYPIHPFGYVDIRTNKPVDMVFANILKRWQKDGHEIQDFQLKLVNLESKEDLKYIGFHVPACIALMCEYLEIFNDSKDIRTLKPMIYTYWS